MPPPQPPVVTRLAPSPTGELHLGHARSFVIAWWHARQNGGRVVMRMDDLDVARATQQYAELALEDLEWLGLDWDGPLLYQSQRQQAFAAAAAQLEATGSAFACVCSRGDIRRVINAPHLGETEAPYPGTCRSPVRSMSSAEAMTGKQAGLRFIVPDTPIHVVDELRGTTTFNLRQSPGDFLIVRRDKTPAYQLSVVVDDAFQGVTDVLRGDDLLSSTPRQIALLRALGLPVPRYTHLPLVVDGTGKRLAKRDAALSLRALRAARIDPRRIIAWIAKSCGLDVPIAISAAEVRPSFDVRALPTTPVAAPDVASLQ